MLFHNLPISFQVYEILLKYLKEYGILGTSFQGLNTLAIKTFECKIVNIFLPITFNICLGAQKSTYNIIVWVKK